MDDITAAVDTLLAHGDLLPAPLEVELQLFKERLNSGQEQS